MLNSGVGMDIDGMFLRAMATSVDVCQNVTNKKTIITSVYNGIPETLLLNVIAWILLIALFTTLRHQAGDYGRLASQSLVNRSNKKRWTEVFYSGGAQIYKQPYAVNDDQPSSSNGTNNGLNIMETAPMSPIQYDSGIFAWIKVTWKLRKEQILLHTGPDAVHYLSFQQHLMFVMAIVTAVSSFVILPINFLAGPELGDYDINSFGRTTMSNLSPDSAWLWIHVIVTIAYVPLVVLIMRRASGRNAFKKAPTRTIMISNISLKERSETTIKNNMKTMFPHINIEDVKLAYNISKLYDRNVEYEKAREARFYCENHRDKNNLQVRPEYCSCRKEKAYDFYVREEQQLAGDVARLRAAALNEPLGTAFLTVPTVQEAQEIVNYVPPRNFPQWQFSFAPSPDDLFWENLNTSKSYWYVKWTVVNCMLFLVLFFLTTPAIVVNFVNNIPVIKDSERKVVSPLVSEFLPTLMLWTLSVLMPVIVAFSDKWMSHYTRSLQNYSIMTKCFGYLLFMILILPSLGLTSAQALLESLGKESVPWQCIFLPDRGSFYVNYIITTAFIGTALELLRFPELIVYIWMLLTARSRAETPHIRKSILIEFPFGSHYAWAVLVFTISIVYSVFCPLIMPFAMVYIGFKHFVDRHNLYFAYGPSNMISRNGGKIHSTAVTMTKFSVVILLLIMAMISTVRGAGMARTIILIVTLAVTLTLFTFMSPIKRCTAARRPSIVEIAGPSPIYEPAVLNTEHNRVNSNVASSTKAMPLSHVGSYGTDSVSDFDIRAQCSVTSVDA